MLASKPVVPEILFHQNKSETVDCPASECTVIEYILSLIPLKISDSQWKVQKESFTIQ